MNGSRKSLQQPASDHSDFRDKSIQGKIFDQSIISCLRGDDDQALSINNGFDIYAYGNEDMKEKPTLEPPNLTEQKKLITQDDSTYIRRTSYHNFDQVLPIIRRSSVESKTNISATQEDKKQDKNELKPQGQIKQQSLQKIYEDSMSSLNNYLNNFRKISSVSQGETNEEKQNNQEEEEEEVSAESQVMDLQVESVQNVKNRIQSPVTASPTSQKNFNFYSSPFLSHNQPLKFGVEQGNIEDYHKATTLINKVMKKSMNRVQKINQHVRNFIQNLKYRMNGRKLYALREKEYQLLNDVSYFYEKKGSNMTCPMFGNLLFLFTNVKIPLPVFMPTATLRVYWDMFLVIFTYSFIYIYSIHIFFYNQEVDSFFIEQLFSFSFYIFILDALIIFNTAYFDKDCVIKHRKQIGWKYISCSIFLTDCINLLIMGAKIILQDINIVYNPGNQLSILFFNLLTFLKLNGIKPKRNSFSFIFTLTENQKHIMRLFDQLLSVITVAHVVSLAWYQLAVYETSNGYSDCWIKKYGFNDLSQSEKYIYSIYWSITTMTTVGYGDITPSNSVEALFTAIVMMLFSCVFAYSINNIGFILHEIQKSSKQLNDNLTTIQRYMSRKNVNLSLQSRVRHYLSFLAEEQKDRNQQAEMFILGILSNKLRDEIAIETNTRILRKNNIFTSNFSQETLRKLVFIMEEVLISPNEIIFEEGEKNEEDQSMYFIENGIIEIFQTNRIHGVSQIHHRTHLLKSLERYQYFGEISFFSGMARSASARSVNLSTLYKINRKDFIQLIQDNPDDFEKFKMIEEQIKFQKDLSSILIYCYSCKQPGHVAANCPRIHQIFDSQFKALKNNFSIFQDRHEFKRLQKTRIYSGRQQLSKKKEDAKTLKENNYYFNTYTKALFDSDHNQFADGQSEDSSIQSSMEQSPTIDSSESSSNNNQSIFADRNPSIISPTGPLMKLKTNMSHNEKSKSSKKGRSKKGLTTPSPKQIIPHLIKEEKSLEQNSRRNLIDAGDNLESNLNQDRPQDLNSIIVNGIYTNQEIEAENYALQKSTSLSDRMSEAQPSNQRNERLEADQKCDGEIIQVSEGQPQSTTNQGKLINLKSTFTQERTNSSMIEHTHQSSIENNIKSNGSNTLNEEKQSIIRRAQNHSKQNSQINYTHQSTGEINLSDERFKEQREKKSIAKMQQKKTEEDKIVRPSIEILLSNAIHQANQMNQQSEMNKIKNSLSQLEDRLSYCSQIISAKSVKLYDHNSQLSQAQKSHQSVLMPYTQTVQKKRTLSDQNCKFGHHQQDKQRQIMSQQTIKFSQKCISSKNINSPFKSLPSVDTGSQKMLERISKLLGLQGSFMNILRRGTNMDQSIIFNPLSMDYFDIMTSFQTFFPHNNIENILLQMKQKRKQKKNKTIKQQISKQRRQKIAIDSNSQRKSIFCNAIYQKYYLSELNIRNQNPTYLSYGVSQKGNTIFPKNLALHQLENILSYKID